MAKQLSLYLPDEYHVRLAQRALRNCRRLNDEARYILFSALDLEEFQQQDSPASLSTSEVEAAHGG
jgi:plasmid stability protein